MMQDIFQLSFAALSLHRMKFVG